MEVGAVRGVVASVLGMITRRRHARRRWRPITSSSRSATACGRLQDRRRHRAGSAGAVSTAGGGAAGAGRDGLADGGIRSGRCPGGGGGRPRRIRAVERVIICTPDKDLAQCVRGDAVVQLNRRTNTILDEAGVDQEVRRAARVDSRLPRARRRRGRRLSRPAGMGGEVGGGGAGAVRHARGDPGRLARVARQCRRTRRPWRDARAQRDRAFLFRTLATLRTDIPLFDDVEDLRWTGPTERFAPLAARLEPPR